MQMSQQSSTHLALKPDARMLLEQQLRQRSADELFANHCILFEYLHRGWHAGAALVFSSTIFRVHDSWLP